MSVYDLQMIVCSSITLSVLLEKFPFNTTHSRSEIEWPGLLNYTYIYIYVHIYKPIGHTCLLPVTIVYI